MPINPIQTLRPKKWPMDEFTNHCRNEECPIGPKIIFVGKYLQLVIGLVLLGLVVILPRMTSTKIIG